jgi:hypothetical protein
MFYCSDKGVSLFSATFFYNIFGSSITTAQFKVGHPSVCGGILMFGF